jgi:signal transduction histidine kinase
VAFDGERFALRGRAQGFLEDSLVPMIEDPAGNLWFGGNSAGIVRLPPHGLITYDALDGLDSDNILSIVEDAAGTVYAISATNGHTLERFDRDHFVAIQPRPADGSEFIGAWTSGQIGFFDRDDRWWQATSNGLDHFPHVASADLLATTPPQRFLPSDGLPGRDIYKLFEDREGDVWIATATAVGLARWSRATNQVRTVKLPGVPDEVICAFAQDAAGAIWLGYLGGALVRVRGEVVRVFGPSDGWTAHRIEALLVDHLGRLWVGDDEGVARIDDPSAPTLVPKRYRRGDGLSTDQITALAEDAAGRIYTGSIRGVDRIEPVAGTIDHLTSADGLPNDLISAIHRDRHGQMWFATQRGVARLAAHAEPPPVVAPTYLTSVRAGTRQLELAGGGARSVPELELDHDESNLDVAFTSPSFAVGVPVQFEFRLEGGDEDVWIGPTTTREVHYAHLSPGSYRFSVRAAIAGVVSAPATFELEVLAPFWRRAWFLLALASLVAAMVWRIYRWRVDHLLAVERVRSRIASDLHDDLGASLARISVLSEVAARRTEGVNELVATIGRDARDLMESASDVVWATDPRHDDLAHVLARIRTFAGELLDGPGIAWTLTAPRDAARIALGPDQRRHLYLILKEAVANIARHAGATRVTITVEQVGRGLVATVEDDGCGIAADATMGHGLENMRARAREAGGSLTIATPPGGGTRITLALRSR